MPLTDSSFGYQIDCCCGPVRAGANKADDDVPTNGTHTYVYFVPERAGPGPEEPSSKLWM